MIQTRRGPSGARCGIIFPRWHACMYICAFTSILSRVFLFSFFLFPGCCAQERENSREWRDKMTIIFCHTKYIQSVITGNATTFTSKYVFIYWSIYITTCKTPHAWMHSCLHAAINCCHAHGCLLLALRVPHSFAHHQPRYAWRGAQTLLVVVAVGGGRGTGCCYLLQASITPLHRILEQKTTAFAFLVSHLSSRNPDVWSPCRITNHFITIHRYHGPSFFLYIH